MNSTKDKSCAGFDSCNASLLGVKAGGLPELISRLDYKVKKLSQRSRTKQVKKEEEHTKQMSVYVQVFIKQQ